MKKVLFSLFDLTGNASRPYRENGWTVIQIDIQLGIDILEYNFYQEYLKHCDYSDPQVGIIAMIPCTDYALSGARWFADKDKDNDGRTEHSQKLVAKVKEAIDLFEKLNVLQFWQIENPMSRIHKLNDWMGSPALKFNPCDYAGYDPEPDKSRYNKRTWLWGNFNIPEKKSLPPFEKESPIWKKYGGKSQKTKNARSITPMGFAYAFYEANK